MSAPLDAEQIGAFLDGELSAAACADLEERLQAEPQSRALLKSLMVQRDALHQHFSAQSADPAGRALTEKWLRPADPSSQPRK